MHELKNKWKSDHCKEVLWLVIQSDGFNWCKNSSFLPHALLYISRDGVDSLFKSRAEAIEIMAGLVCCDTLLTFVLSFGGGP